MPKKKAQKKIPETQTQTEKLTNQEILEQKNSYDSEVEKSLLTPDYDKLESLKEEVIQTENNFEVKSEPEKTEGKKRGRKKKSEIEVQLPEIDFSILFDILIKRLPNPEPLSDMEKTLINNSANKVYNKYVGEFQYADEINLGLVLLAITYPRLKTPQENLSEIIE